MSNLTEVVSSTSTASSSISQDMAYCVSIQRAPQDGLMPSFFPTAEPVVFPTQCVQCGRTDGLRSVDVIENRGPLKFENQPRCCGPHATAFRFRNIVMVGSILVGVCLGAISAMGNWLVIGRLEVSLVVWPVGCIIVGWGFLRLASAALGLGDVAHQVTAPVEVVAVDDGLYVLAFSNQAYSDRFVELNHDRVVEYLGPVDAATLSS